MTKPFVISDLTGGINQYDTPGSVPNDQCVEAENVEFFRSTLGERRAGSATVTIGGGLDTKTHLSYLHRHLPTADQTIAELWAFSVTSNASPGVLARKTTSWSAVTQLDTVGVAGTEGFSLSMASLHGKLFIAHKSAVDRLHVSDGTGSTTTRRVGIATPAAAPTGANTGVGTFNGTRYYRVRYTVQSGGVTIRRSEPSAVLTFTPSDAGTGVIVTKPATVSEGETHWELEASSNNADFYRIATTVVGTTTVTDSQAYGSGYAVVGTLSETSGDYTVPISVKFLTVDADRLVMAGSWDQPALGSRVSWSVVGNAEGVGNDERVPIESNNFIDLDTYEGGDLTGLSGPINGLLYAFKYGHIYRILRTRVRTRAYDAFPLTKQVGAIPGSLIEGADETGRPCLYFLDPKTGPWRIGQQGLQYCGLDLIETWGTVNIDATTVVARGLFYPHSRQVKWWVSVDTGNTPTLQLNLQTNHMRSNEQGVRRGWSTATGAVAEGLAACLFADNVNAGVARTLTLKPLIGRGGAAASVLMLDTGTIDITTVYRAHVLTKPYILQSILDRFGVMTGAVLATAAAGISLFLRLIKDFGTDEKTVSTQLDPSALEAFVITPLDDMGFSDLRALQIEYGDDTTALSTPLGTWELHQIAFRPRVEEQA